jgi:hypothetical protein
MKALGKLNQSGFTAVEIILASVIFPLIVIGVANSFDAVRKAYTTARQLNEVYAVLSACPELDRALDYTNLSSTANCFPNNTFTAEGGGSVTYSYNPALTVTDTSALPSSDPLKTVPDSKIVDISVIFINNSTAPAQRLRMLITRNGVAQQ